LEFKTVHHVVDDDDKEILITRQSRNFLRKKNKETKDSQILRKIRIKKIQTRNFQDVSNATKKDTSK
jgi:hypothetical protein